MATIQNERQEPDLRGRMRRPGPRQIRVQIRRVSPWSVLKFSLLFYFCLMLVVVVGLTILYLFLDSVGILDSIEELLGTLGFGTPSSDASGVAEFRINGGFLFRTVFLIGLISAVVWSALMVFVAFLYNLISDLVGSIEVTLEERRS